MLTRRVVRLKPLGGMANQMLQLMFAEAVRLAAPDTLLTGHSLPDWGLEGSADVPKPGSFGLVLRGHVQPMAEIVRLFRTMPQVDLYVSSMALRTVYFRDYRAHFDRLFQSDAEPYPVGDRELLVHVRLGDILAAAHRYYIPPPLRWYEQLAGESGLSPVFLGQLGDDPYSTALRRRFPAARFLPTGSIGRDFATLRTARHVVTSVSTFSWLSTWLSQRAETIVVPVAGLFHPEARPDIDALPTGDPRYRFWWSENRSWSATPAELARLTDGPDGLDPIGADVLKARFPAIGTDGTDLIADASGPMPVDPVPFRALGAIGDRVPAVPSGRLRSLARTLLPRRQR